MKATVRTAILDHEITYTGEQLRSGFVRETAGMSGDAAVAFLGPCDVSRRHMVDRVDLEAGAAIASPMMLHLIIEHPGVGLGEVTVRQRLLMAIAGEILNQGLGETLIRREGDDLYLEGRKLSVSVATVSRSSGLIHAGFNVRGEGAPVAAIGLEELGFDPRDFADRLLGAYSQELDGIAAAARNVREVP